MSGRQRQLSMGFLAEPSDVNFGGKVHGGQVMRWIDQAGYAAAVGWSGHYSVTAAVGRGSRAVRLLNHPSSCQRTRSAVASSVNGSAHRHTRVSSSPVSVTA